MRDATEPGATRLICGGDAFVRLVQPMPSSPGSWIVTLKGLGVASARLGKL